jgi:hypothetical protein
MWIMHGRFEDGDMPTGLWTGHGWTQDPNLAHRYENPDEAQDMADALHLAGCTFDHAKARRTVGDSLFVVRHSITGEAYKPKPLVNKPLHFFIREGWRERSKVGG